MKNVSLKGRSHCAWIPACVRRNRTHWQQWRRSHYRFSCLRLLWTAVVRYTGFGIITALKIWPGYTMMKDHYYWPPTRSVGGQTSNGHWRLSSSVAVVSVICRL